MSKTLLITTHSMQKTKIATQVSRQNGDSTVCRKAERVDSLKAFERLILNVSSLLGFQRKIRIGRRTIREGDHQTLKVVGTVEGRCRSVWRMYLRRIGDRGHP